MKYTLSASVAGSDPFRLFDDIAAWPEFLDAGLPYDVGSGNDTLEPSNWRAIKTPNGALGGIALWDDRQIETAPSADLVTFTLPDMFGSVGEALHRVLPLPFYLTALETLFPEAWRIDAGYPRWRFGRRHIDHGWGCLFRGAGHDRLVSRRWLDHGPWRTVHLPNDTTFVQFHDLAITDPVEAYEQARYGHQRMGVDAIGGYIQGIDTDAFAQLDGIYYYEDTHLLEVVIPPQFEVPQQTMRTTCALRLHHRLTHQQDGRIDRIAYVFINRRDAELYLHELWLRELECWYLDEHGKHRLDADYRPTPQPPAWVAGLSANPVNDLPR